jgi:hypothetical protein
MGGLNSNFQCPVEENAQQQQYCRELQHHGRKMASIRFWFCNSRYVSVAAAATGWNCSRVSVIEGESTALFTVLRFTCAKGFDGVIFESDSQIVDAISLHYVGVLEFSILVSSINNLLFLCPNYDV